MFSCMQAVEEDFEGLKIGYLLLRVETARVFSALASSASSASSARRSASFVASACARLFTVYVLYLARFLLFWVFLDVVIQIMGTSDGPSNLLLNALALEFVLALSTKIDFDQLTSTRNTFSAHTEPAYRDELFSLSLSFSAAARRATRDTSVRART